MSNMLRRIERQMYRETYGSRMGEEWRKMMRALAERFNPVSEMAVPTETCRHCGGEVEAGWPCDCEISEAGQLGEWFCWAVAVLGVTCAIFNVGRYFGWWGTP